MCGYIKKTAAPNPVYLREKPSYTIKVTRASSDIFHLFILLCVHFNDVCVCHVIGFSQSSACPVSKILRLRKDNKASPRFEWPKKGRTRLPTQIKWD